MRPTVPRLAIVVAMLLLVASVGAEAQDSLARMRVAYLGAESPTTNQHFLDAFREGLREHGYIDGQNIALDVRWADGRNERFPALVRELVVLKPSAILAISTPAARAAANETSAVPVIFIAADPVGSGLLPSLSRPPANVTGLSITLGEHFAGKWLELLKEIVPSMSKVAVLWNPTNPSNVGWMTSLRAAARTLGVTLQPKEVRDPDQLQNTFKAFVADRVQTLVVLPDPLTVRHRGRIAELAANNRLPAMYGFREFADAGGLMAYGVNVAYLHRRAAVYVDRILKGAKVADLPVEQSTKFELVVNLKTAKALGLALPASLLVRADQMIE